MLFDLRSRRRRGAVRVVYGTLALLMIAGLVLVGVGTGSGNGGLLNAFTNGSSNSGQNAAITSQVGAALKATRKHPNSASAWASLIAARYSAAGTGSNYNSSTLTYTASGKKQLQYATEDWTKYLALAADKPALDTSVIAARTYQSLSQWAPASTAWQYAALAEPAPAVDALNPYFCMALNSYAAKLTAKGDLAASQVAKLAPTVKKAELKTSLTSAKSSATTAAQTVAEDC